VAQIAPDSFLGVAFKNLERRGGDPSDDLTASSSLTDEDESDEGQSETSLDSSGPASHQQCQCCSRSKSKAKKGKSTLKPIPPKTYDGSADARAYHWFIRESDSYLHDGQVQGTRHKVFTLSHFFEGKVYDFYTQKVSINEREWPLPCFFQELFDYCFRIDYRMQTRKRLARCSQGERTITKYSHELQELFNMIGTVSEWDQVLRFWNSIKPKIQSGLWRAQLNPEISNWDEVLAQAEIKEISKNVAHWHESRAGAVNV
jgi:hypothetical protein